jgi:putative endonuclease
LISSHVRLAESCVSSKSKTRNAIRDAQEALLPRQQARIARAAELYLAQWRGLRSSGVRFDTITISGRSWPQHLRDAWRPGAR